MVAMLSMIQMLQLLMTLVSLAIAFGSQWSVWLIYINAPLLLLKLYLHVVSIPLELNYSRSLYAGLLPRIIGFVFLAPVVYAIHYWKAGLLSGDRVDTSFLSALYFSFTTWTTLGYGDLAAPLELRLATSIEALTGILTISVLTAVIWLHCQETLLPESIRKRNRKLLNPDEAVDMFDNTR